MKCIRALAIAAVCLTSASLLANTYTVTNTADTGPGSLRQAMTDANGNAGLDTIAFNISGAGCDGAGVCTITPASQLPTLSGAVLVDGYTQPGATANTNALGAINAVLKIVVSGTSNPASAGLVFNGTDNTIRGLVVNGFTIGFHPTGSHDSRIQGCFVGVDAAGQTVLPNSWGINAEHGTNLTIGGPAPADRNLLSGNSYGMEVRHFPGTLIQGNLIGTTASGDAPLGNIYGIGVALNSTGTLTIADNVVAGNGAAHNGVGIVVYNEGSSGDPSFVIQGNWVGTDITGEVDLGNFPLGGIAVSASNVTVGGPAPGEGNVIAFNTGGVQVYSGAKYSPIRGNSIYANEGIFVGVTTVGIDLNNDSVTPNDLGDSDSGANDRQNFPIITSAVPRPAAPRSRARSTARRARSSRSTSMRTRSAWAGPRDSARARPTSERPTSRRTAAATRPSTPCSRYDRCGLPGHRHGHLPGGNTSEFSQRIVLSSIPAGGVAAGGTPIVLTGFNFLPGADVTVGATPATNVVVTNYNPITAHTPSLAPGTLNGITVTNTDGTAGTLPNGWIADFLDVPTPSSSTPSSRRSSATRSRSASAAATTASRSRRCASRWRSSC